jgi:hypothetical protein
MNLNAVEKRTVKYRLISVSNVATFIVFRLSTTVFMLVWDCLHFSVMEPFYFGVLFFVMFSMLIVNVILFYRVLLADSYLQPDGYSCILTPWQWVPLRRGDRNDLGVASVTYDGEECINQVALEHDNDVEAMKRMSIGSKDSRYEVLVPDEGADVIP